MAGLLANAGDTIVVNSCAVTSEAVRSTRQTIRRARRAHPEARLLVTGCAAEVEREMLAAMPEVDGLIPNARKLDPRAYNLSCEQPAQGNSPALTRAFVQVQNGCDHACTFCIIPQGRGPSRSRSILEVLDEVARHVERGVREVVLTGVDLTSWGTDLSAAPRLGALARAILDRCPELPRLRLSSLDGAEVDAELFDLFSQERRLMPHLHLSLQHGDDMMLKRMKRRHSRRDAFALVEGLRAARPDISLGADLIAGFPTETDDMHRNNLSIIQELGIVHGHVFPFSARSGTPAARMPQCLPATIKERAAELRGAVTRNRKAWLAEQIGTPLHVLAERDGTGHAQNFAPVRLPPGTQPGAVVTITPSHVDCGVLA